MSAFSEYSAISLTVFCVFITLNAKVLILEKVLFFMAMARFSFFHMCKNFSRMRCVPYVLPVSMADEFHELMESEHFRTITYFFSCRVFMFLKY